MAHLIPILQDIIPIFRPGKVQVVRSTMLDGGTGQTEGMIRKGAIVGISDHICASVMIAKPHTSSAVHHHAEQDTIIYAASGHGSIITNPSLITPTETPDCTAPSAPEALIELELGNVGNSIYSPSQDPRIATHPDTATLALVREPVKTSDPSTTTPDPNIRSITMSNLKTPPSSSIPLAPTPSSILSPDFPTGTPQAHISTMFPTSTRNKMKGLQKHTLAPGDFALIPAWIEHQELNESDDEVVWIITRSGSKPVVVNLTGWGGKEA